MSDQLPVIYVARHGDTAWSLSGQHTGLTDLPLTQQGEEHARALKDRLSGMEFAMVLTSPLQRAKTTCGLAGFASVAQTDNNLVEWDYGNTKDSAPPGFTRSAPAGTCSAMALPEVKRRARWRRAQITSGTVYAPSMGTYSFFQAGSLSGCWPPGGSGWPRLITATRSFLVPQASASLATIMISRVP